MTRWKKFPRGHSVKINEANQVLIKDDSGEICILHRAGTIVMSEEGPRALVPVNDGGSHCISGFEEAFWFASEFDMKIEARSEEGRVYKLTLQKEKSNRGNQRESLCSQAAEENQG